jgi:hypothetical protein
VYTDGIDTFEIQNIQNGYYFLFDVIVDVTYTLISVEEVGGCKVYSPFGQPAVIDNIGKDPGLYAELWLCPNYPGTINLFNYLNGTPETGGTWFSENPPVLGNLARELSLLNMARVYSLINFFTLIHLNHLRFLTGHAYQITIRFFCAFIS